MRLPVELWPALSRISGAPSWPPQTDAEADQFLRQSAAENLLPLLFEDDSVPPIIHEARKRFAVFARVQIRRTELLVNALRRIGEILHPDEFLLLKGADYAFRLYEKPHLRPMGDLDFMVPAVKMGSVVEKFRAAGLPQFFGAASTRLQRYHEKAFVIDNVTVEPHDAFLQRARHRIDYDAVWSRRVPFEAAGVAAFRLAEVDGLLYSTLRLAKDEYNGPLVNYLDCHLLLDDFKGELQAASERAREWRIERAFYAGLRQTARVFPSMEPRIASLLDGLLSSGVRRHIDDRVLPSPFVHRRISRSVQVWRKFNMMDGYRERLRFLFAHAIDTFAGAMTAVGPHEEKPKP
jgi:Uncharacterised nucleotidyltransferase